MNRNPPKRPDLYQVTTRVLREPPLAEAIAKAQRGLLLEGRMLAERELLLALGVIQVVEEPEHKREQEEQTQVEERAEREMLQGRPREEARERPIVGKLLAVQVVILA